MKRLPDSELEIMQIIWEYNRTVTRKEIEIKLEGSYEIALTTLLTLLTRLSEKGFVQIDKIGRNSTYTALIDKDDYLASVSNKLVNKLFKRDISVFANALCNSGLSEEELNELSNLLKERLK